MPICQNSTKWTYSFARLPSATWCRAAARGSQRFSCCCSATQVISDSLGPHELQHARLPCPSPASGACSNSCPLSQWCHPTISSVIPFSPCAQPLPALGSFAVSQFFPISGQSIGALASAPVLSMDIRGWFLLAWTGLISLMSKGLLRV